MKLKLIIESQDIKNVHSFFKKFKDHPNVKMRIKKNIKKHSIDLSKEHFWRRMITCILTSQQKWQRVEKFTNLNPFPLDFQKCLKKKNLKDYVQKEITKFGGLRFANNISKQVYENLEWIQSGGWETLSEKMKNLKKTPNKKNERELSKFIDENLSGFGPKQSRNLLQDLGLTINEIPIDSRIMKWANKFGFPIHLKASGLSDENYYNFILDIFQELCSKAKIYPCLMDAAIFSSFDKENI